MGFSEDEEAGSQRSRVSSSPHIYGGPRVEREEGNHSNLSRVLSFTDAAPETYQYEVEEDEIEEDGTVYVLGETPAGDGVDDIPVRLLTDFTIYDLSTREVVSVGELQQLGFTKRQYGASGKIKPWFIHEGGDISDEDDEFEDLEDGEDVLHGDQTKLTKIIEFNVYDLSETGGNIDL
jgi:DNA (cytosine-5)-methyltransferase 1